jgi:hypothetical protein
MKFNIKNRSNLNLSEIKPFLESFLPFAQRKMGFDRPPSISFVSDLENANETLGKTAFYDPNTFSVSVYTDQRHPKDVMRSLSHELVHHAQNCRGNFDKKPEMGEGYFQNDGYMREMEREAYEIGNMCFREWEETYKKQLQESIYYSTGDTKMNHKDWKNQELFGRLMENFGYKQPIEEIAGHIGECGEAHPDMEHEDYMNAQNMRLAEGDDGDPPKETPGEGEYDPTPLDEKEELEEGGAALGGKKDKPSAYMRGVDDPLRVQAHGDEPGEGSDFGKRAKARMKGRERGIPRIREEDLEEGSASDAWLAAHARKKQGPETPASDAPGWEFPDPGEVAPETPEERTSSSRRGRAKSKRNPPSSFRGYTSGKFEEEQIREAIRRAIKKVLK